jgi:hypothetical protein
MVKTYYQPITKTEKKTREEAVGQVILPSLRRIEGRREKEANF